MSQVTKALGKMAHWCARQERCIYDVRRKLDSYELSTDETDQIIEKLINDNYLNEERFATYYVRDKFRFNGWGRIKIRWNLAQKKVSAQIIQLGLDEINDDEYIEKLTDLLSQKMKSVNQKDKYQQKAALLRFSQSRGFEYDLSLNIIDRLMVNQ